MPSDAQFAQTLVGFVCFDFPNQLFASSFSFWCAPNRIFFSFKVLCLVPLKFGTSQNCCPLTGQFSNMIRNLKLIAHQPLLVSPSRLAYPLTCCPRSFSNSPSCCTRKNWSLKSFNVLNRSIVDRRSPFNGPAILAIRHQSTSLSENEYEKIVAETLESLSDYFDELLENQDKVANYDLSLSVSCQSFGPETVAVTHR